MKKLAPNIFGALFVISIVFLSFLAGAYTVEYRRPPYHILHKFFVGFEATQTFLSGIPYHMWKMVRFTEDGVVRYDADQAYDGLTLMTSAHSQAASLIDMNGRVVHEWALPYSAVWGANADVSDPFDDTKVHWSEMHLYPNGDLLAVYTGPGDTPYGYGLVKMDRDSNVIWTYLRNAHHDVSVDRAGTIYTLTHAIRSTPIAQLNSFYPPFLIDSIAVLSPEGQELRHFSILDAIIDSPFAALLDGVTPPRNGDLLHANAIDVVDAKFAAASTIAEQGQVLVSLRNLDVILVIDIETELVTWAYRGPWRQQHDPDMLDDGNILIFDNLGHYGPGGRSRIIEFNPETHEIVWMYTGDEDDMLESFRIGTQQRLPNGNTLITESYNARIIEVTPSQEIVWEFHSPHRVPTHKSLVAIISSAQRFPSDWFEFDVSGSEAN